MEIYSFTYYTKSMAVIKSEGAGEYKNLNIALVLDDIYPSSSGVSRSIQSQINELAKMGQTVTLIAPEKGFSAPDNAE